MNTNIKLEVPIVFNASIIKPNCTNVSKVLVRAIKPVEITEFSKFPVAMKVGKEKYHWADGTLWMPYDNSSRIDFSHMSLDTLKDCTEKRGRYDSNHLPDENSPFYNFWQVYTGRHYDESEIELKGCLNFRKFIVSNEEEVIESAREIAKTLCVHKGKVYTKADEPFYQVFRKNGNPGSATIRVTSCPTIRRSGLWNYNAAERELAINKAVAVTGKDKAQFDSLEMIEVFNHDAVKMEPRFDKERLKNKVLSMVDVSFKQGFKSIGVWRTDLETAKSIDKAIEVAKGKEGFSPDEDIEIAAMKICESTGDKDYLYKLEIDKDLLQ